jgi:hypothetical protein
MADVPQGQKVPSEPPHFREPGSGATLPILASPGVPPAEGAKPNLEKFDSKKMDKAGSKDEHK